ncbi:MAG: hypothetical protein ACPLSY_03580 [Moorellaceae bacterium]
MSKLYFVRLRGHFDDARAYVVAENLDEAVKKLQKYLSDRYIGSRKERELDSVTLIADSAEYPDCRMRLFL